MNYGKLISQLSIGMITTVSLFLLIVVFSIPLGMLICKGRMSRNKVVRLVVSGYISIMRGTPLILQLLFFYFAPYYLFKLPTLPRFWAAILAFVLNYAAYFAEIYRGGMQSFDQGQYEACKVLGFSQSHTFIHIVLPQVAKNILPSVGNEIITLVKDTSLAMTIGVIELFQTAKTVSSTYFSVVPIFVAGLFYFIMNYVVSKFFEVAENKLNYYR